MKSRRKQRGWLQFAIPAAASVLGSAISSNSSAKAAEAANQQNAELFREGNRFNADQAGQNRTFQAEQAEHSTPYRSEHITSSGMPGSATKTYKTAYQKTWGTDRTHTQTTH